jgi:hypothetical protein
MLITASSLLGVLLPPGQLLPSQFADAAQVHASDAACALAPNKVATSNLVDIGPSFSKHNK